MSERVIRDCDGCGAVNVPGNRIHLPVAWQHDSASARSEVVRGSKSAPWSTSTTLLEGTLNSSVTMATSPGLCTSTRVAALNRARVANADGSVVPTQRRSTSCRRITTLGPDRKAVAKAIPVEIRDEGVAGWS